MTTRRDPHRLLLRPFGAGRCARLALVVGHLPPPRRASIDGEPDSLDKSEVPAKARRSRRAFSFALHRRNHDHVHPAEIRPPHARSRRLAEAALDRLYTGESLTEAEAEALFAELVAGPAARARHRRHAGRAPPQGRERRGADRRRPGAARRRRRFPPARLSVRRQLRHRRRRLGLDQRLDRRRLRRRRGRPAGRQARQPLGHLALRLGRRARAARRQAGRRAPRSRAGRSTRPASASCSRRSTIPAFATPGRCGGCSRCARS